VFASVWIDTLPARLFPSCSLGRQGGNQHGSYDLVSKSLAPARTVIPEKETTTHRCLRTRVMDSVKST